MAFTRSSMRTVPLLYTVSLLAGLCPTYALPRHLITRDDPGFNYQGCFIDEDANFRALGGTHYEASNMTVESCQAFCSGFNFFGLEFAGECYCGNTILNPATDTADCSMPCNGNVAETCGGSSRMGIFTNLAYLSPKPATVANYPYTGCFIDSPSRYLKSNTLSAADMTAAKCAENCQGYAYFGTEWGRECYCGNEAPPASASTSDSDCSMTCAGEIHELCGGPLILDVYGPLAGSETTSTTTSSTTTSETSSTTDMSTTTKDVSSSTTTDDMPTTTDTSTTTTTTDSTATTTDGGITTTTTDDSTTTTDSSTAPTTADSSTTTDISTSTTTDISTSTTTDDGTTTTDTTSTTTSADSTTATDSATTTSSASTSIPTISDFAYQGCYTDLVPHRVLTGKVTYNSAMTLEKCASTCSGYSWFGVEFATQCFCGTFLDESSTQAADSECNKPCGGDSTQICGAGRRLSVYSKPDAGSVVVSHPVVEGFEYLSCWIDHVNSRSLGAVTYRAPDMTVSKCADKCENYNYFGVEYSTECYCGDSLHASAAPESDCGRVCAGNSAEFCGGGSRLNVYRKPLLTI